MVNLKASARMRLAAAAAVACLAAGVPAVAIASSSAPATPRCNASNTYVWFGLSPNGAAGTIYYPVEFTNVSSNGVHADRLSGRVGDQQVRPPDRAGGDARERLSLCTR